MNQFQPPPNIFDPITISHLTFSIFSSSGGALNLPAPTAQTAGSIMTADLRSLFAGVTSSGWSWMSSNSAMSSLNIGGIATGSFNDTTNAFDIAWTNPFNLNLTTLPVVGAVVLTSGSFSLQGTAQVAAVPLPAAVWLFGSGVVALTGLARRNGLFHT
ncbi:MAG TPA: VPLPA-CTERM sorting domain-containing protein [Nitrospira sp.]|nr:VPLPA-CTERM sorting domain-containing protein [Nitrospira sp.]